MFAQVFFFECRYEVDETSPEDSFVSTMMDEEPETYEILSKKLGVKAKEPVAPVHNGFYACGGHCCH